MIARTIPPPLLCCPRCYAKLSHTWPDRYVAALTCSCGYVFYPGPAPVEVGEHGAGNARRWMTSTQRRAIAIAVAAGTSVAEVASEFGVSGQTVRNIARAQSAAVRRGAPGRERNAYRSRATPEQLLAVVAALKSGKTCKDAAALCDVAVSTVYRVAHKAGLR